jgi:hypothetical protein
MDKGSPVRRTYPFPAASALHSRSRPHFSHAAFLLCAAVASRSSPTRKRCAVDPAPVHKFKFSCTTATTLRSIQARFAARTTFSPVDPTQPAQVDGSSSTHLPQGALEIHRICVRILIPDSGHTPPLSSRFKLDCTTLPAHVVPAPAILLPPTPSLPSFTPFPVPPLPPSRSLSSLGPLLPRTTPPFPAM